MTACGRTDPIAGQPTTGAATDGTTTITEPTGPDTSTSTPTTGSTTGSGASGETSSGETSSGETSSGETGPIDRTSTGPPAGVCGDGIVDPGEACDDGDRDDGDACTGDCALAACGDGLLQQGVEGCDDGNVRARDGCDADCQPEGRPDVYLASALSDFGFHGYFIALDQWVTLPGPPTISYSQLTNDGERVYSLGDDNVIRAYAPDTRTWTDEPTPGPGIDLASVPTGLFEWTDQGFYYLQDGPTTLYHFKDGAWVTIGLPNVGSCAGTWVAADDELYIRSHQQTGFMVVRTLDDVVVRSVTDITQVPEPSRMGAVAGGFFYVRGMFGPLERLDAVTGEKSSTGQFPESAQTAADTDPATGSIYLAGYQNQATSFQRYDPGPNQIVTLADSPGVPDLSTITVMIAR